MSLADESKGINLLFTDLFPGHTVIQVDPNSPQKEGKLSWANMHNSLGQKSKMHFLQITNQWP